MPAEDHGSVPHRSLYDGLEWVFEGWQFPNLPAPLAERGADVIPLLEAHAARLTERFGFTEARASYDRAVRRATETSHPVLPTSQANLARVTAKIAEGAACPAAR